MKRRARERQHYDNDWRYRIQKRLHDDARARRATIERRRTSGALQNQG